MRELYRIKIREGLHGNNMANRLYYVQMRRLIGWKTIKVYCEMNTWATPPPGRKDKARIKAEKLLKILCTP